ncbi:MAG TPA: hypothetical protein VGJ15_11060 [Pirellulales bacterium]
MRCGASIVIVLALIAITMAMSYAMLRTQFSVVRIQSNSNRQALAKQAAMVGLTKAIWAMEQTSWPGVGTTLTGTLSGQDSYSVTYTAGDDSLTSASSNYGEYPYRVMLVSTGTSVDPNNSASHATHRVRAVVRLIPQKLGIIPSDLASIANYTWYQTNNDTFQFQVPLHVAGKSRIQGEVQLGGDYQWSNNASDRYLDDLDQMRLAGMNDDRPFTGPLEISFSQNNGGDQNWLTGTLGVSITNNTTTGMSAGWAFPGTVGTYKLYAGGPTYTVPTAPTTISTALVADPVTNPLGIFYQSGDITLATGASLKGTLIGGGHVTLTGNNLSLAPVDLLPLITSSNKVRLPTLLASDDLVINDTSAGTVDGMMATFDKFNLKMCPQAKVFSMHGNLVAKRFYAEGRNEFNLNSTLWSLSYSLFKTQLNNSPATRISYYPVYMQILNLLPDPKVTFQGPDNPVTYTWPTNGFTVYVADPVAGALRWEMVDWRDLR